MSQPLDQHDGRRATKILVSVVVPTRNRPASLRRALASIARQERSPDEVIIVDASDEVDEATIAEYRRTPKIDLVRTRAHLCRQRNEGVRRARGDYVLLCDDDVELPPEYVGRLLSHLETHRDDGAVTGPFRDPGRGGPHESFPAPPIRRVLFAFLFQLSLWGDVEGSKRGADRAGFPLHWIEGFYRRRGNTWSLAGWPLVTQVRGSVVHAAVYTLGAALVRREWLLLAPYDERLGPHGVGDHYGVALGFPRCPGVAILTDLEVTHHRAAEGRLADADSYLARILALDHFTRGDARFGSWTPVFLIWSLLGSSALHLLQRKWAMLRRALRGIAVIASGANPYRRAAPSAADRADEVLAV